MKIVGLLGSLAMMAAWSTPLPAQTPSPSAPAADDARAQAIARYIAATKAPLRHPLRDAANVDRRSIEVGKRADGTPIEIDLAFPQPASGKPVPVVLLLHGGLPDEAAIRPKAWQVFRDWGTALAASGVAAVMFDHSLGVPRRRLDQALGETDAVLAWLAKEGPARGLDTQRLGAFVFSAGGLFVPELLGDSRPLRIDRVAMFYPSTGVVPGSPTAAVTDAALAARMNLSAAAKRLASQRTQLLILRGGGDALPGLLKLLDETTADLLAADVAFELINVPGAPHNFDAAADSDAVRAAIDRALAFAARR
jgi:acetyl esterase/lipase